MSEITTTVGKKSTAGSSKFTYKYTELSTIHEELEKQGITYYQYTAYDEHAGADYVYTVVKPKDGEPTAPIRGAKVIESNTLAGGNAAQQYGSALTYARRYSLLMALGWATEDDDANSAGAGVKQPPRQRTFTNGVNFAEVRDKLTEIDTIDELNRYWIGLHLTEGQANILKDDFARRKSKIGGDDGVE